MNDGASIHDNTCKTATIGLSTTKGGSSIVLNGGEIHHNTVTDAAKANVSVLSVPAGAISLSGSSTKGFTTFTMNGGKIYAQQCRCRGQPEGRGRDHCRSVCQCRIQGWRDHRQCRRYRRSHPAAGRLGNEAQQLHAGKRQDFRQYRHGGRRVPDLRPRQPDPCEPEYGGKRNSADEQHGPVCRFS